MLLLRQFLTMSNNFGLLSSFSNSCSYAMRSSLVTLHLVVATAFILFYIMPASAKFVCLPCNSQEECDRDPPEYCYWGEVRDACNRRMCAKGPGERCGGALNVLGQCGEGLMCKSDEICHGCSILTMKCYND